MASVKLHNGNFKEIEDHIQKALDNINTLKQNWKSSFSNVSYDIVDGKLKTYYDDQQRILEENIRSSLIGGKSTGSANVSRDDGYINVLKNHKVDLKGCPDKIIISAFDDKNISFLASDTVTLKTEKKEKLTKLIENCKAGNDEFYIALEKFEEKLKNVKMALQLVLFKIAEYQSSYANLQTTADEIAANGGSNIALNLSADGVLLGINTTITVDGKEIEIDTSSAMNAFFTYSNTFMNAEIEAAYLEANGASIDYSALVSNTNAFMTSTIESGLYSHTFISNVLPIHVADTDAAYDAATAATKLNLDTLKSLLDNNKEIGGDLALYGGLLGVSLLGPIGAGTSGDPQTSSGETPPSSTSGALITPNGPGGSSSSSGGAVVTPTPSDDDDDKKDEDDDSKLEDIVELEEELPEEVSADFGEVDYDQLARDNYEFGTSVEDIIDHRNELIDEFQRAYETGDLTSLETKLKKYGYSDAEIEAILDDRFKSFKALLEGDERAILAESAVELAAADGIEDYESHWSDRPNFDDLTEGPSELLTLSSTDDNIRQLKTDCDTAKENYQTIVEETNTMLKEVSDNKAKIQEIKEKYDEKYGEDTEKWSSEAISEYNEAVKAYNESVNKIPEQLTKLDEAKTTYDESVTKFTAAKEEYYKKLMEDSDPSQYTDAEDDTGSDDLTTIPDGSIQDDGVVAGDNGLGVGTGDSSDSQIINMDATNNITNISTDASSDNTSSDGVVVTETGIGFGN